MLNFIHIRPFNLWSGWVLATELSWTVDYPSESPGIIFRYIPGPFLFHEGLKRKIVCPFINKL